jgi:hypothetical protein
MGAAQCSGIVESRQRQSYTYANADPYGHTNSHSNAHAYAKRQWLRAGVGFEPGLHGRQQCQPERD